MVHLSNPSGNTSYGSGQSRESLSNDLNFMHLHLSTLMSFRFRLFVLLFFVVKICVVRSVQKISDRSSSFMHTSPLSPNCERFAKERKEKQKGRRKRNAPFIKSLQHIKEKTKTSNPSFSSLLLWVSLWMFVFCCCCFFGGPESCNFFSTFFSFFFPFHPFRLPYFMYLFHYLLEKGKPLFPSPCKV